MVHVWTEQNRVFERDTLKLPTASFFQGSEEWEKDAILDFIQEFTQPY